MTPYARDAFISLLGEALRPVEPTSNPLTIPSHKYDYNKSILLTFILSIIAIIASISGHYYKCPLLRVVGLFSIFVAYISLIYYIIASSRDDIHQLVDFIKNPTSVFIIATKDTITKNNKLLSKLTQFSIEDLEEIGLALENSNTAIPSRMYLIVGVVEKVGLLPGIIALLATAGSFFSRGSSAPFWVQALVYATPVLYFLALMMIEPTIRGRGLAELVKLIISRKMEQKTQRDRYGPPTS